MPHETAAIEHYLSDDSREIDYTVTEADSDTTIDVSGADLSWYVVEREYEAEADAVLSDGDSGVEIDTSTVDPTAGEVRIDVDKDATTDLWGRYTAKLVLEQGANDRTTWRSRLTIEA